MKKIFAVLFIVVPCLGMFQCHPERSYETGSDAKLEFSLDTVYFDTIFTRVGTLTKSFRIHNPHDRFVKIDDIILAGGEYSVFRINVDGTPDIAFENFEIAPHDSMYVFIEATLGENNSEGILRIQDSIVFETNGNTQDVDLVAWGQDVHMFSGDSIIEDTIWTADKPYLIIDYLHIYPDRTLTIEEGVEIYMHRDSWFYVQGSINLKGKIENEILIQGDRLETYYQDDPGIGGQWGGIYFLPGSKDNFIDHAHIRNGMVGLWADSVVSFENPVISVTNTKIEKMSHDGILARGTTVEAANVIIGDCGNSCVELLYEGSYSFSHCTFNNNWSQSTRNSPSVFLKNYFSWKDESSGEIMTQTRDIVKADFRNCVISGGRGTEIEIDKNDDGLLNYKFDHCFVKIEEKELDVKQDPNFINPIYNVRPVFDSTGFAPDSASPLLDVADIDIATEFPYDFLGNSRFGDKGPDIGAIERLLQAE